MGKRVSIFGCGVQKGGTTSLHAHFLEHPELSPPSRKETHFFDDESLDWSAPDYTKLEAFYAADDGEKQRFDITPIYTFWPPCLSRIRAYNPDARLIFLFRDPFERAWSQWCMEYARGWEKLPFAEAIRGRPGRLDDLPASSAEGRVRSYVERGFYATQVRRALDHFPREQLLFLLSDDLANRHLATLDRIAGFLQISLFPNNNSGPKREFSRTDIPYPSSPTKADREFVAALLADEIGQFAELTGLDVSSWLSPEASGASPATTTLSRVAAL